jgi:ribonuclease HI
MDCTKDGFLKINVDGAQAKALRRGAWAAICRDGAGVYQGSSVVVMDGVNGPSIPEALACKESLALDLDIGARRLEVTSDCSVVIEAIKLGTRSHFSSVIREI